MGLILSMRSVTFGYFRRSEFLSPFRSLRGKAVLCATLFRIVLLPPTLYVWFADAHDKRPFIHEGRTVVRPFATLFRRAAKWYNSPLTL